MGGGGGRSMVSRLRMDHRTSGGGTSDDSEAVRRGMAFGWGCWCVKIRRISHREAMEAGGAPSEPGRALDLREHAWIRTTMVEGEVGVQAVWDGGGGDAKEEGVCGPS